ncbi:MAG: sulfatase-like hydrolase/transferase [Nitrospiraceae bacterium]|nr:sulfatase-like hydrolase/transferase [Nitrospiraceae bacterium]
MSISRRGFLKLTGAGACLSALGCVTTPRPTAATRPNIILCMADDQGWGEMGYNGHPSLQTPNFDAMAQSGLRFDRFYAAAPVCSPTRASVMTGRHPNRMGCLRWGHSLRPQETTIAEALGSAGYATGHFGKWHLGSVRKGSPVNPGASGFDEWFSAPNYFDNDPIMSREGLAVQTKGESSMVTVNAALDFVRRHAEAKRPFLAVVWFGSPHRPHQPADEDRALYAGEGKKQQNLHGEITGMDRAFGKLRQELRTLGIAGDTILWYCSDNGGLPEGGATGGRGHKGQVYEGGLRVPALLEWPARIPRPRVTNVPCNTSDIYPTLLDIAGVRVEGQPPLDGISLVSLFGGRMRTRPRPMGFWDYPAKGMPALSTALMKELYEAQQACREIEDTSALRLDAGVIAKQYPEDSFPGHAAWLDWPWKLHRIEDEKTGGRVHFELYHLEDDPGEEMDLLADYPGRVKLMKAALNSWQVSVVRSLNGEDYKHTGR